LPYGSTRAVWNGCTTFKRTPVTNGKALYWQFGQYGGPGLLFRLSDEIGRQLAEQGLAGNAPSAARA
jgi:hypothetical protein